MRAVGGLVGGLVAGAIVMMLVALLGGLVFPLDRAVDPYNVEEVSAAFSSASMGAQIVVILSWFLGALAGAAVAKLVSGAAWAAWAIAIIFALYVLASVFVLPMPGWMQAVAVALPLVAGYIAARLRTRHAPAAATTQG